MKHLILFFSLVVIFFGCSGSKLVQPVLKESVEPVYPYEAKVKGIEGSVDILLVVNELGDVTNTRVLKSSGHKILDDASTEYSRKLKFEEYSLDGWSVPVFIKWRVNFKLKGIDVENGKINVLAFSKTEEYRHESIETGKSSLTKLALENNFHIDFSEDASVFNEKNLSQYNVIVFLNTTGNILDSNGEHAFQKFIRNKGGFVGIHSATDTEHDWNWYGELVGTRSKNPEEIHKAVVRIIDKNHPSTKDLPYTWEVEDEWSMFTNKLPDEIKVLAVVDEITFKGEEPVLYQPYCWYHDFDGGRAWFTVGGHKSENYSDPLFMKQILGGIKYAAGVE